MKFDYLSTELVHADTIRRMLEISEPTLARWIKLGLPTHQVLPRGRRMFIPAEVWDWYQSRCITPAPDQGVA